MNPEQQFPPFFDYDLPPERIAQRPAGFAGSRTDARLLHYQASADVLSDTTVARLPDLLRSGDLILLNDSRVLACRFFVSTRGGGEAELFFLERRWLDASRRFAEWDCLARPMKRFRNGDTLDLAEGLTAVVLGRTESGDRLRLRIDATAGEVEERLFAAGRMPIPPYIREGRADESDRDLYQTVVAAQAGSVAAPTAGLHFTERLLAELETHGIQHRTVTLHVGAASMQPVADLECASAPTEQWSVSAETARAIETAKREGRRIVAVGTTVTRTLESMAAMGESFEPGEIYETSLFIKPGFQFRVADVLMTNFHQPRTTHLLLVAAFIGEDVTFRLYRHALAGSYRFLSYGDSMLLERA